MSRKPLREQDIEVLRAARDGIEVDLQRTHLVEAFKRGGAKVVYKEDETIKKIEGAKPAIKLYVQFGDQNVPGNEIPIGRGTNHMDTVHRNWRERLSHIAGAVLEANGIT